MVFQLYITFLTLSRLYKALYPRLLRICSVDAGAFHAQTLMSASVGDAGLGALPEDTSARDGAGDCSANYPVRGHLTLPTDSWPPSFKAPLLCIRIKPRADVDQW